LEFEWSAAKAATNLAKHQVAFEIVFELDWSRAVAKVDDRFDYGELRLRTILIGPHGVRLMIVFTLRQGAYRIISVRRAHEEEYEEWQEI
jgi:uncharacterized DUF497 family protein